MAAQRARCASTASHGLKYALYNCALEAAAAAAVAARGPAAFNRMRHMRVRPNTSGGLRDDGISGRRPGRRGSRVGRHGQHLHGIWRFAGVP